MKKFLLALMIAACAVVIAPFETKADAALDYANNFGKVQSNWLNQQWNYYNTYQQPVITAYDVAMTNQYSQALAARYQSDMMAKQAMERAAANSYQLFANEYAHQQNLATQYTNLKNMYSYNMINNLDQAYYNNQEAVLRMTAYMLAQPAFPQVQ